VDPFFERLKASLHAHPSPSLDSGGMVLKEASVLAPLFMRGGEPYALLTMRPETLRKHPGQVAFPGGGREPQDVTPLHTALRELDEELGIKPEAVEVLGMLGTMPTVTSFLVTPFVGVIPDGLTLTPSAEEVQEVLEVPLLRVRIEKRRAYQADRDAYVWEGSARFIWGATYRMVQQLLEHVTRAAGA
jgi:8-oxo-dGTP pyrophosphatase MutT (NUDIX family)